MKEQKFYKSHIGCWWKCERCGKLIPYMADFCHECADKILGEPPKPFEPQEREKREEISDRNMKMWEEIFKAEREGMIWNS